MTQRTKIYNAIYRSLARRFDRGFKRKVKFDVCDRDIIIGELTDGVMQVMPKPARRHK